MNTKKVEIFKIQIPIGGQTKDQAVLAYNKNRSRVELIPPNTELLGLFEKHGAVKLFVRGHIANQRVKVSEILPDQGW